MPPRAKKQNTTRSSKTHPETVKKSPVTPYFSKAWISTFVGVFLANIVLILTIGSILYFLPWRETILPQAGDAIATRFVPPIEEAVSNLIEHQTDNLKSSGLRQLDSAQERAYADVRENFKDFYYSSIEDVKDAISSRF